MLLPGGKTKMSIGGWSFLAAAECCAPWRSTATSLPMTGALRCGVAREHGRHAGLEAPCGGAVQCQWSWRGGAKLRTRVGVAEAGRACACSFAGGRATPAPARRTLGPRVAPATRNTEERGGEGGREAFGDNEWYFDEARGFFCKTAGLPWNWAVHVRDSTTGTYTRRGHVPCARYWPRIIGKDKVHVFFPNLRWI
jgi:hypothetical protein